MRSILVPVIVIFFTAAALAQQPSPSPMPLPSASPANTYVRPDQGERAKRYFMSMFGPRALGKRVVTSAILTWSNSPTEWGTHWDGFGKRFASATGTSVISNTTQFGLEEAFKLDSHFYRSNSRKPTDKIKNAFISPFIARNEHGKKVVGFPHVVGAYAGTIVASETWMPDKFDWKDGLKGGTLSLGADVVFNLVKEFIHK